MEDLSRLFRSAADHAADYRRSLPDRPVGVPLDQAALAGAFAGPLPAAPCPPEQVLADLLAAAEPGLVASAGPRYFGFVVGGALPAATAADMLAAGWDQLAFNAVTSPAAIAAEAAAGSWLKELLGIPAAASVGFVTGAQAANTAGLAAARHQVLADAGWDVERRGLLGAPPVRVIVGDERHAT
ncbi:aspartate aminotransferase family protein, partial [Micromonospora sp. NPDC003776]